MNAFVAMITFVNVSCCCCCCCCAECQHLDHIGLSETPRAIQSASPLRPHSPSPPQSPPPPTSTSTTTTATTTTVAPTKKRSRVANRGDAFPTEVQEAHDEHELQEQYRRADELARASAAAHDPDDDVDDKVAPSNNSNKTGAAPSKRPRKETNDLATARNGDSSGRSSSSNRNHKSDDDNDADDDVDGDEDDDKQSGDEGSADSSLASDELDDGRPKHYVGIAMGVSTIRLVCEPSSLRELQQVHGANALTKQQ